MASGPPRLVRPGRRRPPGDRHDGDSFGQHTEFLAIPELGFAFVVLTNAEPGGKLLAQAALDTALGQYPETTHLAGRVGMMTAVLAPAGATTSATAPARPVDYVGSYRQPYATYAVRDERGQLVFHTELTEAGRQVVPDAAAAAPPDVPLTFVAEDVGLLGPVEVAFLRRPDGSVGCISTAFRIVPRADP